MSRQIGDKFKYKNRHYELIAVEFPKKFLNFKKLGIKPVELHTACWRGFILTFSVNDNILVIDQIYTNNGHKTTANVHEINGVLPKVIKPKGLVDVNSKYRILNYPEFNL